jgi:epoxyqueuosine reductase
MSENMRVSTVLAALDRDDCSAKIVSIDKLEQLKEDIMSLRNTSALGEKVFNDYLVSMKYQVPEDFPEARSIIVIAVPQPQLMIAFIWKGKRVKTVVPPTYAFNREVDERVKKVMTESVAPEVLRLQKTTLPLKTLAARSGLILYGRNNIAYVPKKGSFLRLTAFYTNLVCEDDTWGDRKMLPMCNTCRNCLKACPNGVIGEDRFLVKVERCLTFLNEQSAEKEFPDWVNPAAHNAIVGCMHCQRVCHYNKSLIASYTDGGEFSEAETAYLLRGEFKGDKAKAMEDKLKLIGLDLSIFPRNLKVLLEQQK